MNVDIVERGRRGQGEVGGLVARTVARLELPQRLCASPRASSTPQFSGSQPFAVHPTILPKSTNPNFSRSSTQYSALHPTTIMSTKKGAYGEASGGDTVRKTWDKEEYAERARDRERKIKEEGKERYEAALAGKKYHKRASTPEDARDTQARTSRLDVASMVGKSTLVPAGAAVGKRGKGAGFYCEACDLTFKDNISYVEHLNHKQHLIATGQSGEVAKATLEEVHERLMWLKRKREEEKAEAVIDLDARLQMSKEREEKEREERRRKRNEKRRKTKDGLGRVEIKVENDGIIGGASVY